ncbi:hypothetical protein HS125_15685 [bacterium]|nr:hypothetical protein [bacterium]
MIDFFDGLLRQPRRSWLRSRRPVRSAAFNCSSTMTAIHSRVFWNDWASKHPARWVQRRR